MSEPKLPSTNPKPRRSPPPASRCPSDKQPWETPKMEDVSEEVMAQPYIRFT